MISGQRQLTGGGILLVGGVYVSVQYTLIGTGAHDRGWAHGELRGSPKALADALAMSAATLRLENQKDYPIKLTAAEGGWAAFEIIEGLDRDAAGHAPVRSRRGAI